MAKSQKFVSAEITRYTVSGYFGVEKILQISPKMSIRNFGAFLNWHIPNESVYVEKDQSYNLVCWIEFISKVTTLYIVWN